MENEYLKYFRSTDASKAQQLPLGSKDDRSKGAFDLSDKQRSSVEVPESEAVRLVETLRRESMTRIWELEQRIQADYIGEWTGQNEIAYSEMRRLGKAATMLPGRMWIDTRKGADGVTQYLYWVYYEGRTIKLSGKSVYRRRKHPIPMGRNSKNRYLYLPSTLKRHARDWELPLVMKYEEKIARLREAKDRINRASADYIKAIAEIDRLEGHS